MLLRNRSVVRLLVGVPEGHEHIRARIETASGDVITLQEATLAALCRAYMDVSTHPRRRAVELRSAPVEDRKHGFAVHQLIEVAVAEGLVRAELAGPPPAPAVSPMSPAAEDTGISHPAPPPEELVSAPADTTFPHSREQLEEARAAVAARVVVEEVDDLELDDPEEVDDGPVFGDVPTLHSKPRSNEPAPSRPATGSGRKKKKRRVRK